ncbi:MAG: FAD-dependent oxidoreductase [Bauldia sp.]|nr:FAD-dependent oxidoreductase [Bauldia sp.]
MASRRLDSWLAGPGEAPPLPPTDASLPILVVGAGPAGLAAMAALREAGVDFEAFEAHRDVGGNWDAENPVSAMYAGMRMVTSRRTSSLGPPMPRDWPAFVPFEQALAYLRGFADGKDLRGATRFGTRFDDAEKTARGTWLVAAIGPDGAFRREYRGIVFATGSHNRSYRRVPGALLAAATAAGIDAIHASDYRTPAPYAGKRVLVVGIGNSGSDIADKVSAVARRTVLAVRTPPWILPARMLGRPGDQVRLSAEALRLPHWYQEAFLRLASRLATGRPERLGLARPGHGPLERVPVTDRGIVAAIRAGRVVVRRGLAALEGGVAHFEDAGASAEPVDAVIFATGYTRRYPLLSGEGGDIAKELAFFLFHRGEAGLSYMTEMVGPRSCWPVFVEQGRAIAAYYAAEPRARNAVAFNRRRGLPSPDLKGSLFRGADPFHVDYRRYTAILRDLAAWLSE